MASILDTLHDNDLPFLNNGQPVPIPTVSSGISLIVIVGALLAAALASAWKASHDRPSHDRQVHPTVHRW